MLLLFILRKLMKIMFQVRENTRSFCEMKTDAISICLLSPLALGFSKYHLNNLDVSIYECLRALACVPLTPFSPNF